MNNTVGKPRLRVAPLLRATITRPSAVPSNIKTYVKNIIQSDKELKGFDSSFSAANTTSGTVTRCTDIANGSTSTTRIGDQITIRKIWIRVKFSMKREEHIM